MHSKQGLEIKIRKLLFIATLLKIDKKWKQLKCESTDKWINKMVYTDNELFSLKKEIPTCSIMWMSSEVCYGLNICIAPNSF